ncbi:uncharacterized protein LOC119081644 isoform X2 [Bradysia coprophila]|uniref:uncharacterized protein LOC119081644 isoform X2 n=1 Tax=Bradysia coprophila TaxID=38358 RepID=UPI00187DA9D8|nr:uncharacterized protein LOC119081644 isoform X2 [Bradysia coprophila]
MYCRRSLNRIIKVLCRYSHSCHSRQIVLLKCNELRNTKVPLLLPTFVRRFAVGKSKENESKGHKPSARLDLMAPNFRKTNVDRLTGEKPAKKGKIDRNETKCKSDFCRHICALNSSTFTSEINALKPLSDHKVPKSVLEKLTDAEIKEICETRCPCIEAHMPRAKHNFKDVKSQSKTSIGLTNNSEKPPTATQSTAKLQDLSARKIEVGSTSYSGTVFPSTNIRTIRGTNRRNRMAWPTNNRLSMANDTNQSNPIDPNALRMKQKDSLIRSSAGTMQPTPIGSSYKPKSKYVRMMQQNQTRTLPKQVTLPEYQIHPRLTSRIDPRQTRVVRLRQENQIDRKTYNIGPFPAPHDVTRPQDSTIQSHSLQAFRTQIQPNVNPCGNVVKNACHFDQLKPVPFRYQPLYPKNHHSDPVIENQAPMYVRIPYQSINLLQRHDWRAKSAKNRHMSGIQLKMPRTIANSTGFVAESVNVNNVTIGSTKGISLPSSQIEKTQPMDSRSGDTETLQLSGKIVSKLDENLTVLVDGPRKLKLVTSTYPQLRDEKDVIIRMEYVSLSDADARHYLTGKYNPHSYATTTVGRTGSGIIIETGQNVSDVKPGDKVFIKPISCGKCSLCLTDHRNLCEYVTASELSPMVGVLSRFHVHSSEFVTKIPDNVSMLNGAMTWTLSTAIRACQKASVSAGDAVLVIGGGALGMATSLAAQLLGATTVCLADIRKPILDEAEKFGIESVFQIDPISPSKNTAIKLWEQINVYPRITFDCTGSQLANEIAINATQTGGKVVVMTNSGIDVHIPVPISNLVTRDIDVIVSTCGNDKSDIAALRCLSTRKILFENYFHKHYDLSNADEAFEELHDPNRLDSHIIVKCGCACGKRAGSEDKKSS